MRNRVFVGLSGGVDSSVAAKRLIERGYDVVGVFIKTWYPDFIDCTMEAERLDAMRVAAHLQIPFLTCDAEEVYKRDVADYMISEYAKGRTPNPDVMCNRTVKFGVFKEFAKSHGASYIATGHYAQIKETPQGFELHRGKDAEKDQSYFLWTLTEDELPEILFPIGDTQKNDIRVEAKKAKLPTFAKKDSQGVCFLGKIDMQEFLSHYHKSEHGSVLDISGRKIGTHPGALYFTLGQRQGFLLHEQDEKQKPYYVIDKNIAENTITVSSEKVSLKDTEEISLSHIVLRAQDQSEVTEIQYRYRQKPIQAHITLTSATTGKLTMEEKNAEMPSVGQSCVFYNKTQCLGGGIMEGTLEG